MPALLIIPLSPSVYPFFHLPVQHLLSFHSNCTFLSPLPLPALLMLGPCTLTSRLTSSLGSSLQGAEPDSWQVCSPNLLRDKDSRERERNGELHMCPALLVPL